MNTRPAEGDYVQPANGDSAALGDWRLRLRDGAGNITTRWFRSRRGAIQAGRHAERTGRAVTWEATPAIEVRDR